MDPVPRPLWKTTASKYLVNDRWLKLRADTCLTPDGDLLDPWYVLEYPDWVNCVVVDAEDDIILLRHYRHGVGRHVLEIVGGNVEAGDTPMTAIRKELKEEIGYVAGELHQTGIAYPNPSNQGNRLYTFLAVGGSCTTEAQKEAGADFQVEKIPFQEFMDSVFDPASKICYQSMHLTAIAFAQAFLRKADVKSGLLTRLRDKLAG